MSTKLTEYEIYSHEFEKSTKKVFDYIRVLQGEIMRLERKISYMKSAKDPNTTLNDADISVRLYNALIRYMKKKGLESWKTPMKEIALFPKKELYMIDGWGKKTMDEFELMLSEFGL